MVEIDDVIGQVENLYRSVTGQKVPNGDVTYAPIPPERDPVAHVQEQMDRLLSALSDPLMVPRVVEAERTWVPPVSVWEGQTELVIDVDLAGVPRDKIDVSVHGSVLLISGVRTAQPGEAHRLAMNERPMGPFRRPVLLPNGLRTADMGAQLRDGVLTVRIPREERAHVPPRAVPVS